MAAEKLLLIIETRTPGEVGADFQIFADAVADHVLGVNALGWLHIMRAASSVDMVIAGPPATFGRIDPTLQMKGQLLGFVGDLDRLGLRQIFRPAGIFDGISSFGQPDFLAIAAINLVLKTKVRREALWRRGIDPSILIANDEAGRGGLVVFILDLKGYFGALDGIEKD